MAESPPNRIVVHTIRNVANKDDTRNITNELANLYRAEIESTSYSNAGKPAFGLTEVVLAIIVIGQVTGPLIQEFFKPLVTAGGEAFRDMVLEAIRKRKGGIPVSIEFGDESDDEYPAAPVRYYFYRRIDDEELIKRFKAAEKHLKSLPPEVFSGISAPVEYGFFWDRETEQWRGCVHLGQDVYGEGWLPDDIFTVDKDEDNE